MKTETALTPDQIRAKLVSALTQFDAKQLARTGGSRAKGYNPYALGIYFQRVDDIMADIAAGADVRAALVAGMTGRVLDACLRALNLPTGTREETLGVGKPLCYTPVAAKCAE